MIEYRTLVATVLSSAIAAAVIGGGLKVEAQKTSPVSGPDAVWSPGMSIMQDIRKACSSLSGKQFGECFANGMQKSGASPQAVSFTRRIDNTGYVRDFRQAGQSLD